MTLPLALRMQSLLTASASSLLKEHELLVTALFWHRLLLLQRHRWTNIGRLISTTEISKLSKPGPPSYQIKEAML